MRSLHQLRAAGRGARRSRRASISTAKSRPESTRRRLTALYRRPWRLGLSTACGRISLFLPGLLKLKWLIDTGFFGKDPLRSRRVRATGSIPAAIRFRAAPLLELSKRGWRRYYRRHVVPLALRAGQSVRQGEERLRASVRRTSASGGTSPVGLTKSPRTMPLTQRFSSIPV